MENHPIPQDITGFQFKLIGNMTVKQFAYLAVGVVSGWVFYSLPIIALIKFPLAIISISFGASLAFLPIEGRPLDTMIGNFMKALISPTQFVYQKIGFTTWEELAKIKSTPKVASVSTTPTTFTPPTQREEENKEKVFFSTLTSTQVHAPSAPHINPAPAPSIPHVFDDKAPLLSPEDIKKKEQEEINTKQIAEKEKKVEEELAKAKVAEATQKEPGDIEKAHEASQALQKQLDEIMEQKKMLENQLIDLHKQLSSQKQEIYTPSEAVPEQKETKNVRVIPEGLGKSVGLPISPEAPNLVSGIVKDPRGNPLPNILVEVKDQEENPVRAFKTNGLGQFTSATPLTNGTYTMDFEDPLENNKFDTIAFEAKGEIILPVEVISVDSREELRRELFN